ncbi:peptidylprolyl isomerase [Caulobacter flavus]|uniref:peptidylprolyl isomerase n=1 Tax=Caulobacter flavus TaxID=1679497 RepID=A0A2N5CPI7_9CAUL|nr:peptidylprolyl isomerase [Caulobacter flavus]AYV48422.1 peptidylprolyl isomerase [Caulobacter flavus]PLR08863.1 peptidylprolyl isomerase [Caulobacter flavus]
MDRRLFLAAAAAAAAAAATPALAQEAAPAVQPTPAPTPKPATRVAVETPLGRIVIELHTKEAPITTANFLRYVDQKRYDGATFFRASRAPGAPEYGLIQGGVQGDPKRVLPPIAHEPTTRTGLKHVSGTVSIARNAPGTATSDFFILIGDAPGLDANPAASGDNQGFAAFGTVVEGMEVAQKILALPTPGKAINPVMAGQIIDPPLKIISARRAP